MTVVEIRTKLHQQIETGDEKLLKMIYALVKEYSDENIDDARKRLIQAERDQYLARAGKSYSWEEVKNMAIKGIKP